jgi:hypothetical protein
VRFCHQRGAGFRWEGMRPSCTHPAVCWVSTMYKNTASGAARRHLPSPAARRYSLGICDDDDDAHEGRCVSMATGRVEFAGSYERSKP